MSAIYLNRTVISTPAGDLSLEDVFRECDGNRDGALSGMHELPIALTIMGLYWDEDLGFALLADRAGVDTLEDALFRKCWGWWVGSGGASPTTADATPRVTDAWLRAKLAAMHGDSAATESATTGGSGDAAVTFSPGVAAAIAHRRVSSAEPVIDRLLDWATFCSVVALLQASGAYKAVIRQLLSRQQAATATAATAPRPASMAFDLAASQLLSGMMGGAGADFLPPMRSRTSSVGATTDSGSGAAPAAASLLSAGSAASRASRRSMHSTPTPPLGSAGLGSEGSVRSTSMFGTAPPIAPPALAAALPASLPSMMMTSHGGAGSGGGSGGVTSPSPFLGRRRSLGSAVTSQSYSAMIAAAAAAGGGGAVLTTAASAAGGRADAVLRTLRTASAGGVGPATAPGTAHGGTVRGAGVRASMPSGIGDGRASPSQFDAARSLLRVGTSSGASGGSGVSVQPLMSSRSNGSDTTHVVEVSLTNGSFMRSNALDLPSPSASPSQPLDLGAGTVPVTTPSSVTATATADDAGGWLPFGVIASSSSSSLTGATSAATSVPGLRVLRTAGTTSHADEASAPLTSRSAAPALGGEPSPAALSSAPPPPRRDSRGTGQGGGGRMASLRQRYTREFDGDGSYSEGSHGTPSPRVPESGDGSDSRPHLAMGQTPSRSHVLPPPLPLPRSTSNFGASTGFTPRIPLPAAPMTAPAAALTSADTALNRKTSGSFDGGAADESFAPATRARGGAPPASPALVTAPQPAFLPPASPSTSHTAGAQFRAASLKRMTRTPVAVSVPSAGGAGSASGPISQRSATSGGSGGSVAGASPPPSSSSPQSTRASPSLTIAVATSSATATMTATAVAPPAVSPTAAATVVPPRLPPRTPSSAATAAAGHGIGAPIALATPTRRETWQQTAKPPSPLAAAAAALQPAPGSGGSEVASNGATPALGDGAGVGTYTRHPSRFNFDGEAEGGSSPGASGDHAAAPSPAPAPTSDITTAAVGAGDVPPTADVTAGAVDAAAASGMQRSESGSMLHTNSAGAMTTITEHSQEREGDQRSGGDDTASLTAADDGAAVAHGDGADAAGAHAGASAADGSASCGDTTASEAAEAALSEPLCEHEVFLGGACNPTIWRATEAMPRLHEAGVTYYNPQVDDWHPGLVVLEAKAKDEAEVVLFVVGPETRAIASMVEVAELITSGRRVVLVLADVPKDAVINGHVLPPDEIKDLNRGRAYLANVADRHGVTAHQALAGALDEVVEAVRARREERLRLLLLARDQAVDAEAMFAAAADAMYGAAGGGDDAAAGLHDDDDDLRVSGRDGEGVECAGGDGSARTFAGEAVLNAAVAMLASPGATAAIGIVASPPPLLTAAAVASPLQPALAVAVDATLPRGTAGLMPPAPPLPSRRPGSAITRHKPRDSVLTAISTLTSLDGDDRGVLDVDDIAEDDDEAAEGEGGPRDGRGGNGGDD